MADNIDEEHLDNPKINRSENPPDEIAFNANTENINLNQETENMEVHHHGHHGHEKKTWKSYFWEFFMLFLAVFCGFLAEYQLEHKIEKNRARQLLQSFYNDLKTDTTNCRRLINSNNVKLNAFENLFACYDTIQKDWKSTACLIPIVRNSYVNQTFENAEGTLDQLRNAGGYRILDIQDRDSILTYDISLKFYKAFETTVFQQTQDNVRNVFIEILDFPANKFLNKRSAGVDSSNIEIPIFFSENKYLVNKYFNILFRYKNVTVTQTRNLNNQIKRATSLLNYIKAKYKFN